MAFDLTSAPLNRADELSFLLTPENIPIISRYGSAAPSIVDGMFSWVTNSERSSFMVHIRPFEVREESNFYFVVLGRLYAVVSLSKPYPNPPRATIVECNSPMSHDIARLEAFVIEAFALGGERCNHDQIGYFADLTVVKDR